MQDPSVAMYVDLLTRALDDLPGEAGPRTDDELLADVLISREQLLAYADRGTPSAAEALAYELSYDGALIRFCESLDVPTDPERFASPSQERARLEQALAERGYAVDDQ
jgi:hypothetical protein